MRNFIFTLSFLLSFGFVSANPVSSPKAAELAKNHFWQVSEVTDYQNIVPVLVYTELAGGESTYFVFEFENSSGFVIIAADDDVYPVLGYSLNGRYSSAMNNMPDNFRAWMQEYTDQILYVKGQGLKADEQIENAWKQLSEKSPKPEKMASVNPLINTSWDQGCYYNEFCPEDDDGPCDRVYVGCVATTMAQIMKYHSHPAQGVGTHTYYAYPYGQQTVDFGSTTYNWSAMPNQLNSFNDEVATISYHCGVSVNMQYSASGSGAYSHDARDALVDYFSYSNDAALYSKSSYSNTVWENMIKNDLNGGYPLYYAGYGSGGHAFVLDGYQGSNHFHFNWGWSGYFNGYFYLSNLNPGGNNFTQNQEAIFHIYPEGTVTLTAPANLQYEIQGNNDVALEWDAPAGKDLTGYNVYRNNNLLDFTTETNYTDENLDPGTYEYYVTAVYDEGESVPSGSVSVLITGANNVVFEDDFAAYNSNEQLVCQNAQGWTTWSNSPCSSEDPYISDEQAFSGTQSIVIEGANDVVKEINNLTSGFYKISFYMYVPSGYIGYFNTLQEFNGASSLWGMQVYFDEGGAGSMDAGGSGAASFSFDNDTWMHNEIVIDLNNDWAEFILDGTSIHSWIWSIGAFGQNNDNQLGGTNFFAWTGSKGTPKFFIDDYMLENLGGTILAPPENLAYAFMDDDIELSWDQPSGQDPLSYNIYYSLNSNGYNLIENTTELIYLLAAPGAGLHEFYTTAVYDEGESDPSNMVSIVITASEEFNKNEVSVYPNPVKDFLTVGSPETITSVSMYHPDGRLMKYWKINEKEVFLRMAQFEPGLYILRIESGNSTVTQRIIIN